jgi:hypothetical protein
LKSLLQATDYEGKIHTRLKCWDGTASASTPARAKKANATLLPNFIMLIKRRKYSERVNDMLSCSDENVSKLVKQAKRLLSRYNNHKEQYK